MIGLDALKKTSRNSLIKYRTS